jgi:phospholipid transport system substrate-binding protein
MNTRFLIPLFALFLTGSLRAAADSVPETRLKASVDQVVSIAKQAKDRSSLITAVKPVLADILNFETMTRRAVGPGWRQFTPDQQKEAVRLFTTLILRTYTAKFTPGESPSVEFKGSTSPSPGRVEISTSSLYRGSRYDVVYRMEDQSGKWTISDVVIEGVSLVANYRTQFEETFAQEGAAGVIKSLQRSVADSK